MTEGARVAESAGALLRAAREKQGLHIAALAAAIKVAPRKLDALENNRWHELPDATFTRALAQTVCRTLKIDAKPVLDMLPAVETASLEHVAGSLNTPFNERAGQGDGGGLAAAVKPMVWAGLVLLLAAVAVYFAPPEFLPGSASGEVSTPALTPVPAAAVAFEAPLPASAAASTASASSASTVAATETLPVPASGVVQAAPAAMPSASAAPPVVMAAPAAVVAPPVLAAASAAAGPVQLRAIETSWIEARDGRGRVLLSRAVERGEALGLDGPLPIRLTIGNASGTQLVFRGQPVDLAPRTRDNVARLELQ